ncbi:MAG: NAD(P)/FAD-dependent oxidoreductase [Bdellovibrionaceae bacterium]|nr:NAD(P)/FAD-dependent oxidoreductase [Pseudobdellovibrionaceae bacterium]
MVNSKFDTAIIGSGLGGLIAGALLAKQGARVAVFEQHDKVGGFASHFKRQGYRFEVAVHLIEGPCDLNFKTRVFDHLGLWDLPWLHAPQFFRMHFGSEFIDVPAKTEAALDTLMGRFPQEKKGLQTFFDDMRAVSSEFLRFQASKSFFSVRNPLFAITFPKMAELFSVSLANYLRSLFQDEKLIWLLMANIGFYNDDPIRYPTALYLINQAFYYEGGALYPAQGSQSLSDHLSRLIEASGGQVFLRHEVQGLSSQNDQCHSLQASAQRQNAFSMQPEITFDSLILNCSTSEAQRLLGRSTDQPFVPGPSASTLYLGLQTGFLKDTPFGYFNFVADLESRSSRIGKSPLEMSLANYGILSPELSKKPTLDLIFLDQWENWDLSSGDYEMKKTEVIQALLRRLDLLQPGLSEMVETAELGTPRTIQRFTRNTKGAAYGFNINTLGIDEALRRRWIHHRPVDPHLKNVYYASAWSSSHGVTGVTLAGYQAARAILQEQGLLPF